MRRTLLAVAFVPILASAQQPVATDELNQAILRYAFRYDGGNVRLIPGRVPDDLAPSFHAPAGTRVLGTVVSGSTAVVLAATSTPAESLRAEYTRALEPRGWKPFERGHGGFVESPSNRPLVFCREGAQLYITHRRRPTPPHDLQLEYRDGGGMCDAPTAERVELARMDRPEFPTLSSPEAPPARPTSSCYSRMRRGGRGSGAHMSTATVVSSDLPASELLRHYGRQLEAAGWSPPGRQAGPPVVTGTWSQTDSTGTSVVTLEVTEGTPGSGCYSVQMQVSR